jgi:acyl-coenzyme A synthetase/AMP-(fatty) acid ligase
VLTLFIKSRRLKDISFQKLRHIICAGEALPPEAIRFMMEKYPHIQFTNMYGPTEITVDCSYHVIHNMPDAGQKAIPIGKARNNMELFVRDSNGQLIQDAGAKGELLVRGTSVGYGYLGDQKKTRASFIQNPLNQNFHDPLYCTGDNVEIDAHGDFIFIGRADDQIKYLGYRIELGEIEAALRGIKMVTEGVVVFRKEDENNPYAELAAMVHLHEGNINQLTEELKSRLPGYMVPTRIKSFEDEFPTTANGKYDRKRILNLIFGD